MKMKSFIGLATSLTASFLIAHPSFAAIFVPTTATTTFFTDKPNADTTRSNPFRLKISDLEQIINVTVINIRAKDSAIKKANKIRQAIRIQAPNFTVSGKKNQIVIEDVTSLEIIADPTRESLDKLNQDTDYQAIFSGSGFASGINLQGNSSLIQVGIENLYVARVTPDVGESFVDVFRELEMLLDSNNIEATFDSNTGTLSLDELLQPEQNFIFGNTDTTLNTKGSVEALVSVEVPESSFTLSLLIFGGLAIGIIMIKG